MFTGPGGPANQIHDYNVHIDRNDVFWMIKVDDDAVDVDFDDAQASLRVRNLNAFDDHDLLNSLNLGLGNAALSIPPIAPKHAKVSFDVEWLGPAAPSAQIENAAQSFKGTFFSTVTTINWSAQGPGFAFQSDPPNPAFNLISVLGREKNGVFFS